MEKNNYDKTMTVEDMIALLKGLDPSASIVVRYGDLIKFLRVGDVDADSAGITSPWDDSIIVPEGVTSVCITAWNG